MPRIWGQSKEAGGTGEVKPEELGGAATAEKLSLMQVREPDGSRVGDPTPNDAVAQIQKDREDVAARQRRDADIQAKADAEKAEADAKAKADADAASKSPTKAGARK